MFAGIICSASQEKRRRKEKEKKEKRNGGTKRRKLSNAYKKAVSIMLEYQKAKNVFPMLQAKTLHPKP